MSKESDKIELRSEDIQEILGIAPNWLTSWGSTVIFVALVGLVSVAGFVKYPEIVNAPVELTTNRPPISVIAKMSGNIEALNVQEGDSVLAGDLLAVLQNTLDETQLENIGLLVDSFLENPVERMKMDFPASPELGSLQQVYSDFLSSYMDYELFAKQNVNMSSIIFLQQQIGQIESVNLGLENQYQSCQAELNVFLNQYQTDQSLYLKGIISQREVQDSESAYYQKRSMCEGISVELNNNEVRIQQLNMQIFGLGTGDKESDLLKFTQLRENANRLKSEINLWRENYLISAPVDGVISLNDIWSDNQYINEDEELLSIIQYGGEIKARAEINNEFIGKVSKGQNVNIQFQSYNFMQYGVVQGEIVFVSGVPRNQMYQIEIALNNGLRTTYDETLKFQQGMIGNAQVITEKRTVLSRIFDKFKYLFNKKYQ